VSAGPPSRLHRVIPVEVSTLAIADGQARQPVLRDVVGYWLTFSETGEAGPDAAGSWFRARAEPISDKAPSAGMNWDGTRDVGRPPLWPTRLHGDGWVASWLAYRPVAGQVQVYGHLTASISIDSPVRVRGRITHVDGLRVALDLDDLPVFPLRPSIVPGAVATHGVDLWVADTRLPLAVRIRDRSELTILTWPGGILTAEHSRGRQLHADAEGCWLSDSAGVRRLDPDGGVRLMGEGPAWLVAANHGTLVTEVRTEPDNLRSPTALRLFEPTGVVIDVPTPGQTIRSLVAEGDGFEVVLTQEDSVPRAPDYDPTPWRAQLDRHGYLVHGARILKNVMQHGRAAGAARVPDGIDVATLIDAATGGVDEVAAATSAEASQAPAGVRAAEPSQSAAPDGPRAQSTERSVVNNPHSDDVLAAVRTTIERELDRVDDPVAGIPGGDPSDTWGWYGLRADGTRDSKPGRPVYDAEAWRWFRLIDLGQLDGSVLVKFAWDEPGTPDLQYLIFAPVASYLRHGAEAASMVVRAYLRGTLDPLDALRSAPSNQTPGWRNRAARVWLSHTLVLLNPPDGGYEQVDLDRAWYGHAH